MTPINVNLRDLIDALDAEFPMADPVTKVGEARLRGRTLTDLGDQLVDHYVQAARAQGASWSQIGDALGVSKQAAQQRRADPTFERFTARARHVLVLAHDRARTLKHDHVGTGHLLLGILGEPEGIGAKVIATLAGSLETVSEAVHARLPAGEAKPSGQTPTSPEAKAALTETLDVALGMGHNYIGTEHLLLGILRLPDDPTTRLLAGLGVTREKALDEVDKTLAEYLRKKP
jgi:Clp amino terminal domain, pathogenicity island component